jgi:hypothetical protein
VRVCCNKVVIDYKLVLKTMGWGSGGEGSKFWRLKNAIFRCQVGMENSYNFHIPIDKHSTLLLDSNKWPFAQLIFMLLFVILSKLPTYLLQWTRNNFFFIWKKNVWPTSTNFKVMSTNITFGIAYLIANCNIHHQKNYF